MTCGPSSTTCKPMSEDASQAIAGQEAHRYAGGVGIGDDGQHVRTGATGRTLADASVEERAYNRLVFGVTYRERYGKDERICISYCLHPGQRRRGVRCPSCYKKVAVRAWDEREHTPEPSRLGRILAAWRRGRADADRLLAWLGRPDPGLITIRVGVICKGDAFV